MVLATNTYIIGDFCLEVIFMLKVQIQETANETGRKWAKLIFGVSVLASVWARIRFSLFNLVGNTQLLYEATAMVDLLNEPFSDLLEC